MTKEQESLLRGFLNGLITIEEAIHIGIVADNGQSFATLKGNRVCQQSAYATSAENLTKVSCPVQGISF